jgi:hypothetical protein
MPNYKLQIVVSTLSMILKFFIIFRRKIHSFGIGHWAFEQQLDKSEFNEFAVLGAMRL